MTELTPPPNVVDKFTTVWRNWLSTLFRFIKAHTGGFSPTSPATGTSWNAHGNTATGTATSPLKIDAGSLWIDGTTGDIPTTGAGTRFMYMPGKEGAIRAGSVSGTDWDTIGNHSVSFGRDNQATGDGSFSCGKFCDATGNYSIAIGDVNTSSAYNTIAIGASNTADSFAAVAIGGSNTSSGSVLSTAIGSGNVASGNSSVAIGTNNSAPGSNGIAIGTGNTSAATGSSVVIGNNSVGGRNAIAIGNFVQSTALRAHVIGSGIGLGFELVNNDPASMYIGAYTDQPTFTLKGTGVSGEYGKCGVAEKTPLSTLDIGGSVGAKYTYIAATHTGSKTLTTADAEYTFVIDIDGFNSGEYYTINLPEIATIDRRIYFFKVLTTGSVPALGGGSTGVRLTPDAASGDKMEQFSGGAPSGKGGNNYITINCGDAVTISANATTSTWWIV